MTTGFSSDRITATTWELILRQAGLAKETTVAEIGSDTAKLTAILTALQTIQKNSTAAATGGATATNQVSEIAQLTAINAAATATNSKIPSPVDDFLPVIISGIAENGETKLYARMDERGFLQVEPIGSCAFGALNVAQLDPRVQVDAIYGLTETDVETFVSGTGSADAINNQFVCQTGATIGSYGVIRSRRLVRYRPGQGSRYRFTGRFTVPGVANSLQLAGALSAENGLCFGFSGSTFGILRRIAGACAIVKLTITTGATSSANITITLNNVAFTVASGGVLTTAQTAEKIAESGVFTGWTSAVSPQSDDSHVTFIQTTPATAAGTYAISGAGVVGTFTTLQTGAPNDDSSGFVAQPNWNVDVMDGSDSASNPSGILLDPSKFNVFEIIYAFLGAGAIVFRIMDQFGHFNTVHQILFPNANTTLNQMNPTFRLTWVAASLGSSTNLLCAGGSGGGFVEGEEKSRRDPFSVNVLFSAGTTEYVALAIRVRGEFANKVNLREVLPQIFSAGSETANRSIIVRIILNPTLTGTTDWAYVSQGRSCVDYCTPTALAPSGGNTVGSFVCTNTTMQFDLHDLDLRCEPGDILAISLKTASASADMFVAINWNET